MKNGKVERGYRESLHRFGLLMALTLSLPLFAQPWTWPAGWERTPQPPKEKEKQLELDLEMNQTYSHRASLVNKDYKKKKQSNCHKTFIDKLD